MTISEFAKKAVEGGWQPKYTDVSHSEHWFGFSENKSICIPQMMCDALAWQAVGKAVGTLPKEYPEGEMRCTITKKCDNRFCSYGGFRDPREQMHRFIDALCDGKTLEGALDEATS